METRLPILLILVFVTFTSSQLTCPAYIYNGQLSGTGPCGVYYSLNNTYNLYSCPGGQYCPPPNPANNTFCQPIESTQSIAGPGELCNSTSFTCVTGTTCEADGRCTFPAGNAECTTNLQCNSTQFCSTGSCINLYSYNYNCVSDYDCIQSAGCNGTVEVSYGLCVRYFSIYPGQPVASCYGGVNWLCSSGCCLLTDSGSYCTFASQIAGGPLPVSCSSDSQCTSVPDPLFSQTEVLLCTCGFTPNRQRFCPAFPGDQAGRNYLIMLKNWVASDAILQCNTERRFSLHCIYSNWGTGSWLMYQMYYYGYTMYPLIQGNNSEGVIQTYTLPYWQAYDAYSSYINQTHDGTGGAWLQVALLGSFLIFA